MKLVLYTNSVSAHQLPLARELVELLGADNFRYVHTGVLQGGGQEITAEDPWIVSRSEGGVELVENAAGLLSGVRDIPLFHRRSQKSLRTFYMSERWFKPIPVFGNITLPGWLRLLHPRFFLMARAVSNLILFDSNFHYLPIGVWASYDMTLIMRIVTPIRTFRRFKFSAVSSAFVPWAYFVSPSSFADDSEGRQHDTSKSEPLRLLWVGRMLKWKRVDTLIRAVAKVRERASVTLTLVGSGPELIHLQALMTKLKIKDEITLSPPVSINEVRSLMRSHDLYVLPSNGQEGWGAVVSEALEERMEVIGTFEAGASATLLPDERKFHAGDIRRLCELIQMLASEKSQGGLPQRRCSLNASNAALRLVRLIG